MPGRSGRVVGAFAFDRVAGPGSSGGAGVGAATTVGEDLEGDLLDGFGVGLSEGLRGKNPGETPWYGVPPGGIG
jgi:hypothetical protein